MRISSSMIYDLGVSTMNDQLSQLVRTQQQVATGRRILSPEDDPVGATDALQQEKALGMVNQYVSNITRAKNALGVEETVLSNLTQVLQNARQQVVAAGNPTQSSANLASIAANLRGAYEEALGLANTKDGQGNYLFAGYQTGTKPFTQTSGAAVYAGDQGQRLVQVSASRQIAISDSGQNVFKPGVSGNDIFATLETFITALNSGTVSASDLSTALNEFDATLNNVLQVRAGVGTRLNELDSIQNTNEDLALQYQTTLSNIRDVDLSTAISNLTRQQTNLEAAQRSYAAIQGLSLFNFLP